MFSQTVEYALRAVVYLAAESEARTVERMSEVTKVPPFYLAKVVQKLVRAGLLRSQRGVGGGVALVKRPEEVNILEVVNAVDPIRRITTCPLGLAAHGVRLCPLHAKMDRALASIEDAFRTTSLADVLNDPNPSVPLCDGPRRSPLQQIP
jgi:Rrf2 family nitric oxide-sensitive transcriptional repressor